MSISKTINGTTYLIPEQGDAGWGEYTTTMLEAIIDSAIFTGSGSSKALQSAELDLGTSFGIKVKSVTTKTADPAAGGVINLANGDTIEWKKNGEAGDVVVTVSTANRLTVDGVAVPTISSTDSLTNKSLGSITNVLTGATADSFKHSTSENTITLPDAVDTLVGKATTDTLTNKTLSDTTTSIGAVGALTKALKFLLSGATADKTVTVASVHTDDRTVTLPDATDTLVGKATADTLTNKTFSDTTTAFGAVGALTKALKFLLSGATADKTMTVASSHTDDRTVTLPDATDTLVGKATTDTLTNKTLSDTTTVFGAVGALTKALKFLLSGATADKTMTIVSSHTDDRTITLPDATDTLVGKATTDTLTNKSIDATTNTISNLDTGDFAASVLDTDLSSVSASDDTIPSAKATKAALDAKVAGPTSSTDNALARYHETTGKIVQDYTSTPVTASDAGVLTVANTTDASDKDTGALIVEGGVGVEKKLYVGTDLSVGGTATINSTTDASSKDTGALIVEGGAGIEKKLYVGTDLNVAATATAATLKATAALEIEDPGAGTNKVALVAPTLAGDLTLTLPSAHSTGVQFLQNDGAGALSWSTPAGAGDVNGPAASVDNAIVRFDGISGKAIQDYTSGAPTISDTGVIDPVGGFGTTTNGAASATESGLITTGVQTVAGVKTFSGGAVIKGKTDGVAVAAGYVGEVVKYFRTAAVTGSTTLGVYTDITELDACTLSAGVWDIEVSAPIYLQQSAPTGTIDFLYAVLSLTDNSDTVLSSCEIGSLCTSRLHRHTLSYKANISGSTTYKCRFMASNWSGSPTITDLSIYASTTNQVYFIATRTA